MSERPAAQSSVDVVGIGRAGGSFASALERRGWRVGRFTRADRLDGAGSSSSFVLICVPDEAISAVSDALRTRPDVVVAHTSGASTLAGVARHPRHGSIHPLMTLPDADRGAAALIGARYALAGDPALGAIVRALDGVAFGVDDSERVRYHAAAAIASNHVIGVLGQVERIADQAGIDPAVFAGLVQATVANWEQLGARRAITGPAARGDDETIAAHVAAIGADERDLYEACVRAIRRLLG